MTIVIKRYSNRKLYDTEAGEYVTLEQLGEAIRAGKDISVIDHDTGADVTAMTLVQIIVDREKRIGGMLPRAILTGLIQTGNVALSSLRDGLSAMLDSPQTVEQEIRRRLNVLLEDGILAIDEVQRLTELLVTRFRQKAAAEPVEIKVNPVGGAEDGQAHVAEAADPQEVEQLNRQIADLEREIDALRGKTTL